jgi:CBS domain-containing protein
VVKTVIQAPWPNEEALMDIGELCSREVYFVTRDEPLSAAAREMRKRHVGALVVAEPRGESLQPIGIVTDRDIVCGQLSCQADLFCLTVGDVMTSHPVTIIETSGVAEAIGRLSARGVRRAPVINEAGDLVGLISFDDLVPAVARELDGPAQLVGAQARREGLR